MAKDRLHHGPDGVVAVHVQALERLLGASRRGGRDEVRPQLANEERRMALVLQAEATRVPPAKSAAPTEDLLVCRVVALGIEAEVDEAEVVVPVVRESGERTRLLTHIGFGVSTTDPDREQLHHLARVVLVWGILRVLRARQKDEHRGVAS